MGVLKDEGGRVSRRTPDAMQRGGPGSLTKDDPACLDRRLSAFIGG